MSPSQSILRPKLPKRLWPTMGLLCCLLLPSFSVRIFGQDPAGEPTRAARDLAGGQQGAIATGSRESRDAGLAMLQQGGNAVDAAVTSMLVQSVVENRLFCFGSEVPIIVYDAKRNVVEVIVGLGAAPRLATPEWFREHRARKIQGRDDIANIVVPAFLDACLTALERYGTQTFSECAQPMLAVLRQRATLPATSDAEGGARRNNNAAGSEAMVRHHQSFLRLMERLLEAEQAAGGDRLTGLRHVSDYFYRGPIARELDAWSRENGGLLRYVDLAQHVTRIDDPLSVSFNGYTVYKCGVWTQGPYALQTLRMLEDRGMPAMGHNSADYVHLVIEAIKLAMADRDAYYGDPHFVEVPIKQMLSDEYVAMRRSLIDMERASLQQVPGDPWKMQPVLGLPPQDYKVHSGHSNDTTSCLVADQWGNVVSATPSGWGGVIATDLGLELGSRMIGLHTWEGHPSLVAPGKRPRITLTPTLVLKDGKPVMAISVAGGDQQDQTSIQVLLNRLVFGMDPLAAVRTPRFGTDHHINWFGHEPAKLGSLTVSRELNTDLDKLRQRGHDLQIGRPAASAVILTIDPATGLKQAAGDRGRFAGGY
ncbi:MAG: gamma-glutamyltransferase [Pirellulaceae bacterium]|nr:gamma-glutamyltransferase [Pirellulaceae bacterium]